MLSHDLRAPARALRQYAILLNEELGDELKPDAARFMTRMGQVLDRMDHRLDAILTLSRFGSVRGRVERQDLSAIVRAAAAERGLAVTISETPAALADLGRVQWLAGELVGNVLAHAGEGATAAFDFDGERFWFKDTGAGIRDPHLDEVFMVFRPVPHPSTPHLGMGLSCCSRIVRSLEGRMGVECPEGGGTHVYFSLPLA